MFKEHGPSPARTVILILYSAAAVTNSLDHRLWGQVCGLLSPPKCNLIIMCFPKENTIVFECMIQKLTESLDHSDI
jgi:hypothetical protein